MAKYFAKKPLDPDPSEQKEREHDVYMCDALLDAARSGYVEVYSSSITIAECVKLKGVSTDPIIPDELIRKFFTQLILSGKSGITLAQPTHTILERARDLRWKDGLNLKPMDSIHVATAIHHKCTEFLTRDQKIIEAADALGRFKLEVVHPNQTTSLPPHLDYVPLIPPDLESILRL
jgi:predicted nucleic acid-binding protein